MPQNNAQFSMTDDATPLIRGPKAALLLYSIYGTGFGVVLVVIGALTSFLLLGMGAAHIIFGFLAIIQYCKSWPPTRTKHVALVATNAIVLMWGIAVATSTAADEALAAVVLAAIYLPIPLVCIWTLISRPTRRYYWGGQIHAPR